MLLSDVRHAIAGELRLAPASMAIGRGLFRHWGTAFGYPRGSLARGDDLQVAEVAQALGTKLHAKAGRLVACERNIRVGVKVLIDPNRPRFKPARGLIQHGRIPTPDRRPQTVGRIIGLLNGFFDGAVPYDRTQGAEVLLCHVGCIMPRVIENGDREEQTFVTS